MIEHHPFGHPGGTAREDQQCQRRRIHQRWSVPTRPLRVEIPDRQRRDPARSTHPVLDDEQPCAGGIELSHDLGLGQARIDRRHRGAQPPAREQQHHEFNPVAQLERHHIPCTEPEFLEVTACRSNTLQQTSIGQRTSPVRYRRAIGVEICPPVGQRS